VALWQVCGYDVSKHHGTAFNKRGHIVFEQLEVEARGLLAVDVYNYFAFGTGGAHDLYRINRSWDHRPFLPRVLRDVAKVDVSCTLFGTTYQSPFVGAPMACHRFAHPEGELASSRGMGKQRLLTVSTRASTRLEEIGALNNPWWHQVYIFNDRSLSEHIICRAVASGASALVLTGDTPVVGRREKSSGTLDWPDDWYLINVPPGTDRSSLKQSSAVTFSDIAWLQSISGLPVLVKGVLRADDAKRCVEAGANGLVVSSHGGRQMGGAIAPCDALADVVAATSDANIPVLVDGGIRSGSAAAKALALGATAVMIGRPLLWGLTTGGARGVQQVFESLEDDLTHTMQLLGASSLRELTNDLVSPSPQPTGLR
jgi:4-hydroxymandelate oxidase